MLKCECYKAMGPKLNAYSYDLNGKEGASLPSWECTSAVNTDLI